MSNIRDYQTTWASYRKRVTAAVEERDKELSRLEKYEGERAEGERKAARDKFGQAVEAARVEAKGGFRRVLESMRDKAEEQGEVMQAPTAEQVHLLQMLAMRDSISATEAKSAALALAGNDDAIATLQQLCTARGGVVVSAVADCKSKRGKAHDALGAFQEAAGMCLQWSGGNRSSLMSERNAQRLQHVPESERIPLGAAVSADVDAGNMSEHEFTKVIVGNAATVEAARLLD